MTGLISTGERVRATVDAYFDLSEESSDAVMAEIETVQLAGGEWLMRQGEEGDALYLLVQGRLQVLVDGPGQKTAPERIYIGEIAPGDSVGEVSLLTGEPRSASIQAIRDSLLVKIDRDTFDRLAAKHPALVMKLAGNVASVLHKSTSGSQKASRRLTTISLMPLDGSDRVRTFCSDLEGELKAHGSVLRLAADTIGGLGAPVAHLEHGEEVPQSLKSWLNDLESRHDFLLFQCRPDNSAWTRLARRQSDLVVLIGTAESSPEPARWEAELEQACRRSAARRMLVLLQPAAADSIRGTAAWLDRRQPDFHLHVREGHPEDIARAGRIITGNAIGLVLAAGAARGFAHIGVYGALREAGIPLDWVGGTSIGAIMGAPMAADWTYEQARERGREAFVGGKPFSDFTVPLMSLARGRRMERLLEKHVDYRIEDLPIPFFCVSCNLDNGTPNLHERGSLPQALRASAAMIGIIPPAVIDKRLAVDGSVINSMPVDIMRRKPVGTIIAVNISSQKEYRVDYDSLPSPWAVLRGRYLPFTRKYRVAALSTIMLKATELGTLERVNEMSRQADLLLTPPVRKFGMTEIKAYDRIIDAGYEHAKEKIAEWLAQRRPAD
jgi:predicted acylesterase/phospholipase RssA/CRP-like cAMP-binding protein